MGRLKTIRAFLAIPLDPTSRQQLIKQQKYLRDTLRQDDITWSSPKNFHITLCFLGNIDTNQVRDLCGELTVIATQQAGHTVTIDHAKRFPSAKKARVIAAHIEGDEAFKHLVTAVKQAADKARIQTDARPYKGHITLGRCKKRICPDTIETLLADHSSITMPVHEMVLFQSELTPNGPIHTPLAHFSLKTK